MGSKEDEVLLSVIADTAEYSQVVFEASNTLKNAFFKLSSAKRNVPPEVLSSASFREYFNATSGINVENSMYLIEKDWNQVQDELSIQEKRNPENTREILRNRKRNEKLIHEEKSNETIEFDMKNLLPTPIFWFSSMPSQDLRSAQREFTSALTQYIQAATKSMKINSTLKKINQFNS